MRISGLFQNLELLQLSESIREDIGGDAFRGLQELVIMLFSHDDDVSQNEEAPLVTEQLKKVCAWATRSGLVLHLNYSKAPIRL